MVVGQFGVEPVTPKALANWSPGLVQPWVTCGTLNQTLKAFGWDEPFQGYRSFCFVFPGLALRSNRWAGISQRLRRTALTAN